MSGVPESRFPVSPRPAGSNTSARPLHPDCKPKEQSRERNIRGEIPPEPGSAQARASR